MKGVSSSSCVVKAGSSWPRGTQQLQHQKEWAELLVKIRHAVHKPPAAAPQLGRAAHR